VRRPGRHRLTAFIDTEVRISAMDEDKKTGEKAIDEFVDRFSPTLRIIHEQEKMVEQMFEDARRDFETKKR
jgi:hypothetical protein